ncbi:MAG: glycosyltransferase family 2 protein [Bdellovibrionota bacterium]
MTDTDPKALAIVIPAYNEQEALPKTIKRLLQILDLLQSEKKISPSSHLIIVNDGSKDNTWNVIFENIKNYPGKIRGINLSRNKGHQNALLAGLFTANCDMAVSIDADLQDDPNAIISMVEKFNNGFDIVYGVRQDRTSDSTFKRQTAQIFYSIMNFFSKDVVINHADFRLMSKRTIEALKHYHEVNLFLRNLIPQLGFDTAIVHYTRSQREEGKSKYPLRKMVSFAWEGITSFSTAPLKFITTLGVVYFIVSLIMTSWALQRFITDHVVPGWASIVIIVLILGGSQLLCIGVLGEYIGKIYLEVKARPRFFIKDDVS